MRQSLDFESGPARVDHLIDHRTVDFEARARQITGGLAVELVLEAIGGDSLKKGYRLLAPDRQTRDVWGFVGGHEQDGRDVRHFVHAREHALASVQSPVPNERKQGGLRRQPGAYVG